MRCAREEATPHHAGGGLADLCQPDQRFDDVADRLARPVLRGSWLSNRMNKRLVDALDSMGLVEGLHHEIACGSGAAADARERVAGFGNRA